MCVALIYPLSFVRCFASEILYFQQIHILTQTKPNHLLAWTSPNIVRNFSYCDAIKLFGPFYRAKFLHIGILLPISLLRIWTPIVSLHIISAIRCTQHTCNTLRLLKPKISIVFPKCHRTLPQIPHWKNMSSMNWGQTYGKTHTQKCYSLKCFTRWTFNFIGHCAQPFYMLFPEKTVAISNRQSVVWLKCVLHQQIFTMPMKCFANCLQSDMIRPFGETVNIVPFVRDSFKCTLLPAVKLQCTKLKLKFIVQC